MLNSGLNKGSFIKKINFIDIPQFKALLPSHYYYPHHSTEILYTSTNKNIKLISPFIFFVAFLTSEFFIN